MAVAVAAPLPVWGLTEWPSALPFLADNEKWNCTDCSALDITCVYTPEGLTEKKWKEGLERHRAAVLARQS